MNNGTATVLSPITQGYSYTWSNNDAGFVADSLSAGTYTVNGVDINGCVSDTMIEVSAADFQVTFTPSTIVGEAPLEVVFDNTTDSQANVQGMNITYTWDFGNGTTSSTADNVTANYVAGGTYQVVLSGNNGLGCSDTTSVTITVEDPLAVSIPNIFSPNNDGKNDVFRVAGSGIKSLQVDIFNRWGKKVASYSDATGSWNGDDASAGVYFYIITYTGSDLQPHTVKGHVTLVR
jgi:gliding motility-associated-like protein